METKVQNCVSRCPGCGQSFDETTYIPKTLPCSHNLCAFCIGLQASETQSVLCSLCNGLCFSAAQNFPISYKIIQILRQIKTDQNLLKNSEDILNNFSNLYLGPSAPSPYPIYPTTPLKPSPYKLMHANTLQSPLYSHNSQTLRSTSPISKDQFYRAHSPYRKINTLNNIHDFENRQLNNMKSPYSSSQSYNRSKSPLRQQTSFKCNNPQCNRSRFVDRGILFKYCSKDCQDLCESGHSNRNFSPMRNSPNKNRVNLLKNKTQGDFRAMTPTSKLQRSRSNSPFTSKYSETMGHFKKNEIEELKVSSQNKGFRQNTNALKRFETDRSFGYENSLNESKSLSSFYTLNSMNSIKSLNTLGYAEPEEHKFGVSTFEHNQHSGWSPHNPMPMQIQEPPQTYSQISYQQQEHSSSGLQIVNYEVPINHPRRCPRPGCKNLRFVTADGNMFPFCGRQCALMHQQYNQ